jgi:hypothetical protein
MMGTRDESFLGRLHVAGRRHQQRIDVQRRDGARPLRGARRAIGAGVGDEQRAPAEHGACTQQEIVQLGIGDGGGFAGGSCDHNARRAIGKMELEESRPGVVVDAAVRLHRGHERHQAAGEHALDPRSKRSVGDGRARA